MDAVSRPVAVRGLRCNNPGSDVLMYSHLRVVRGHLTACFVKLDETNSSRQPNWPRLPIQTSNKKLQQDASDTMLTDVSIKEVLRNID
jgi:hypothetical protein